MAAYSYFLSWLVNFVLISIFVAIYDESKGYGIERAPKLAFMLAFGVPTLLEFISFAFEGVPFLGLLFPWLMALI